MSDCPASVSDDLENILGVPREYYYLWGDKILLLASKKWIGEFSGLNIYTQSITLPTLTQTPSSAVDDSQQSVKQDFSILDGVPDHFPRLGPEYSPQEITAFLTERTLPAHLFSWDIFQVQIVEKQVIYQNFRLQNLLLIIVSSS